MSTEFELLRGLTEHKQYTPRMHRQAAAYEKYHIAEHARKLAEEQKLADEPNVSAKDISDL